MSPNYDLEERPYVFAKEVRAFAGTVVKDIAECRQGVRSFGSAADRTKLEQEAHELTCVFGAIITKSGS